MSMDDAAERVQKLFMKKLAAKQPNHPWVLKERSMQWQQPRLVDGSLWMDIETYVNGQLDRVGRVTWKRNEGALYNVSITVESAHGLGLYCWPTFRVLSDAQDFIERLMVMPLDELKCAHGTQWPNVVL